MSTQKMRKILEDNTAQNNNRAHANTWEPPFHSSMSPSMSSTGCEQLGWELLGGAAERVTRSVSGTNASHCANNCNACYIARALICRRLLLPTTFTPSTSRQCKNAPLVQSRSLPLCAAITNFACILATRRPYLAYVVWSICLHYRSPPRHKHHLQHSPPPPYKEADLCKRMYGTPDMPPDANHLLACGTLRTSTKGDEVMVASMRVRGTISCNNADHISLVPFCTLS